MIYLPNNVYVELYAEMAEAILVEHQGSLIELYETHENGDVHFTEEAQELLVIQLTAVQSDWENFSKAKVAKKSMKRRDRRNLKSDATRQGRTLNDYLGKNSYY